MSLANRFLRSRLAISACCFVGVLVVSYSYLGLQSRSGEIPLGMLDAAREEIGKTLDSMELPTNGMLDANPTSSGNRDGFGYVAVDMLYQQAGRCLAFRTQCKEADNGNLGDPITAGGPKFQCINVVWYPFDTHAEECPAN